MIELRLLGSVSLTDADGREVRSVLAQPRRLALLAYLAAATPRGMRRRDSLLPLFWPDQDQGHARTALRQAIRVLRGALGAEAIAGRGDEEVGLDLGRVSCDVAAFDRAIEAGQTREAMDLYRGGLLEGFFVSDAPEFERWLETARARLREAAARAARARSRRTRRLPRGSPRTTRLSLPPRRRRLSRRCGLASARHRRPRYSPSISCRASRRGSPLNTGSSASSLAAGPPPSFSATT